MSARTTLRRRLMFMLAGLAGVVLFVAIVIFSARSLHARQQDMRNQLQGLANVVATNTEAAILFKDARAANESLASLSARPEILGARIVVARKSFAHFPAAVPAALFDQTPARDAELRLGLLEARAHLVYPIRDRNAAEDLGALALVVDLREMWADVLRDLLVVVLSSVLLFVLAVLVAQRMVRRISEPIEAMAQTSHHVAQTQRYGLRLEKTSHDEVGELVDAFNTMLEEIEARDNRLQQQQAHLEQQVRTRTLELQTARDAAEAASRAKSEFLASMSHELRTPLNAVLGFAQIMHGDDSLPGSTRTHAAEIERAGRHLLALVNDVIDLARIEAGGLEVSPVPVPARSILAESLELVSVQARDGGITLMPLVIPAALEGLHVLADPVRLRQAVVNLLSNAIKYNRVGGWVRLALELEGQRVRISVQDSGPGIPLAKQARLFRAFDRLGAEFGVVEGSGIGLNITRRLLEAMGGQVGHWSRPGEGSLFWLDLAKSESDVPAGSAVAPPSFSSSGPARDAPLRPAEAASPVRVLCVEDNPVNMMLVRLVLSRRRGVELLEAETAEQGLELVREHLPQMVLMDINLPGMNGYQALHSLREDPRTRALRVVALTASAMKEDLERGLAAGFDHYLTKPMNVRELHDLLDVYGLGVRETGGHP